MRFACPVIAAVLCLAVFATAQTTQPAPEAWTTLTDQICSTLPGDAQAEALTRLIPDETTIQQFDTNQTETRFRMAERLNHMTVLWQHAYTSSPATLVTDLSNSLADNTDLSAALRRQLVPKDPASTAKADATAQRWITRMLAPDTSSLISVVLFWDRPSGDATAMAPREPVFVLIKGHQQGDAPALTQIRYGQMSQALN